MMINGLIGTWACLLAVWQVSAQDIPFKKEEEFSIKVQLEFKSRPPADAERIQVIETLAEYQKRTATTPLPYLYLNLTFTKLGSDEVRFIVSKGGKAYINRKAELNKEIKLDIGFTDDIKDRTLDPEYVITLLSADKKPVSRIVIYFSESGDYIVNGTKRGRI
jgi:hypothetical protein